MEAGSKRSHSVAPRSCNSRFLRCPSFAAAGRSIAAARSVVRPCRRGPGCEVPCHIVSLLHRLPRQQFCAGSVGLRAFRGMNRVVVVEPAAQFALDDDRARHGAGEAGRVISERLLDLGKNLGRARRRVDALDFGRDHGGGHLNLVNFFQHRLLVLVLPHQCIDQCRRHRLLERLLRASPVGMIHALERAWIRRGVRDPP